jgi:N2-acetyl-L-2,4-diaminobutanoate deacetylase
VSECSAAWQNVPIDASCVIKIWECVGAKFGPTVVITAGIHGDEYEGPAALMKLTETLRPQAVSGTVIAIPVANPLAFAAGSRTTPEDGLNLARVFPGNPNGSITERLATFIFNEYVSRANYLIDLHSGGVEYLFMPLAGFYGEPAKDNPSYCSALRFGLPVLWQLPRTDGVLSNEASKRGIVAIGHEYLGAGQLSMEGVSSYVNGVCSCLDYWRVLENVKDGQPYDADVYHGDWQLSPCDGLFVAHRNLGDRVKRGAHVAEIVTIGGGSTRMIAESEGTVLGLRSKAYIRTGNWAILIGHKKVVTNENNVG